MLLLLLVILHKITTDKAIWLLHVNNCEAS